TAATSTSSASSPGWALASSVCRETPEMVVTQRSPEDNLIIAVPKGRVLQQLVPRFQRAGIDTKALTEDSRQLIRRDKKRGVSFLLLKPDDVPTYVEYGAADVGVVGRDVLLEREYDLYAPIDLGIGRCKMMVCGVPGSYPVTP